MAGQDDDPAATDAPDADAPREIEHAAGVTIIESIPERVVVLEWTYAEDLLALGIQPVGVADVAGYEAWVNVEPELGDDVVDVGTRQEPSLESIAALEPDLIIGVLFRHEPIHDDPERHRADSAFQPVSRRGRGPGPVRRDGADVPGHRHGGEPR